MEYIIKNSRGTYIPRIDSWIMDDLKLNLRESILYALILVKGYLIWNSEYIGNVLSCDKKTIQRDVDKLVEKEVITKEVIKIKGKSRWILVGKYTIDGKRSAIEMCNLIQQGKTKLECLYKDMEKYKR